MVIDKQNALTNPRKPHILIIAHLPCVEGVPKDVLLSKASFAFYTDDQINLKTAYRFASRHRLASFDMSISLLYLMF